MRTLAAPVVLALSLAALAACGGGDDDEGSDGGNAPQRTIQAEAQERAESLNLTLSDFPDGWRMSEGEQDDEGREDFRQCVGSDLSALTIIGDANSDDFSMGAAATTSSEATVFESEQMASDALAALVAGYEGEKADECLNELAPDAEDDFEFRDLEIGALSYTPPSGIDEAQAWQVVIPFEGAAGTESEGVSGSAYLDVVALREGDTIVFVQAGDVLTPFDPELRNQLIQAVTDRMTG